jgi:hypothetical protein
MMLLKTFLSNSLDVTLTQALIATQSLCCMMSTLSLLQWVSHNLNSIQKAVTQECCTTTTIITQQSHTDNMNWELTEHIIVTATETEESTEHNECQRRKWQTSYKTTMHALQDNATSLRTANFCLLYNLVSSMLSLLRLWRRQRRKNSEKE